MLNYVQCEERSIEENKINLFTDYQLSFTFIGIFNFNISAYFVKADQGAEILTKFVFWSPEFCGKESS